MPKELSKAIINRSKLANIYNKLLSREYVFACKKQKNLCNNLSKNLKYNCFTKIAFNGVLRNKQFYQAFWQLMNNFENQTLKHFN